MPSEQSGGLVGVARAPRVDDNEVASDKQTQFFSLRNISLRQGKFSNFYFSAPCILTSGPHALISLLSGRKLTGDTESHWVLVT